MAHYARTHRVETMPDKLYVFVEVSMKINAVRLNFYHWCKTGQGKLYHSMRHP